MAQAQNPMLPQSVIPFAPGAPPEGAGAPAPQFATGPAAAPYGAQKPMPAGGQQQGWRGGFGRLGASLQDGSLFESPLLQAGLSLLGNAQNGGNWAGVGQDLREASQQRFQRQRMEQEDRRLKQTEAREQRVFGRQEEEWRRRDQQRAALDAWIDTRPEAERAALRANPEAAHTAFLEAQAAANQPITPYQQAQLGIAERGLGLDAARIALTANRSQYLRGPDRDLMEQVRTSSGGANELLSMAQMFDQANSRTGTGGGSQWLPFSADRAEMRQLSSMMRALMRPVGSGATSDYEQRLYAEGVPSVDLLGPQNAARIRNIETLARLRNARRFFYEDFAEATGSLNGAERAFQQSEAFRQIQSTNPVNERPREASTAVPQRPQGVPAHYVWDAQRERWTPNAR